MDLNDCSDDIYRSSFEILCDSVKDRIQGKESNNVEIKKEILKLEVILSKNNHLYNCINNDRKLSNNKHIDKDGLIECSQNDESDCYENTHNYDEMSVSPDSIDSKDSLISNFKRALENLITIYLNIDSQCKNNDTLKPPPVPVNKMFRKYNPDASDIYDFHKPTDYKSLNIQDNSSFSSVISSILVDSIHSCLTSPNEFDKVQKYKTLSHSHFCNILDYRDYDSEQYYKILKVLFGWYLSGYYTGRMEVLAQLDSK